MTTRRSFLYAAGALIALGAARGARARASLPLVSMYMNIGCGCCEQWQKHMRDAGFSLEAQKLPDVEPMKRKLGVPASMYSCHTATVGGYVIEGHVPAQDIERLLRERPRLKGLAVPGMVPGSPGMEQGARQPYATIAFDERETRIYARH